MDHRLPNSHLKKVYTNISLTLCSVQMLKLGHREAKRPARGNTATKWPNSNGKLGIYTPVQLGNKEVKVGSLSFFHRKWFHAGRFRGRIVAGEHTEVSTSFPSWRRIGNSLFDSLEEMSSTHSSF